MHHQEDILPLIRELTDRCMRIDNFQVKKDLLRMTNVLENLKNQLDQELVVCRNHKKYTARYTELLARCKEHYYVTSKYLTVALLTFPKV